MTDNGKLYYEQGRRATIRNYVLFEMIRGAGWGGLLLLVIGGTLFAIYLFGLLLPEDSKNAPPPMPYSQIQIVAPTTQA